MEEEEGQLEGKGSGCYIFCTVRSGVQTLATQAAPFPLLSIRGQGPQEAS